MAEVPNEFVRGPFRKIPKQHIILVNGASSGFDMMTAKALADDGHTVYASMRETERHNIPRVADVAQWSTEHSADMRTVELDLQSEPSLATAIEHIVEDAGASPRLGAFRSTDLGRAPFHGILHLIYA